MPNMVAMLGWIMPLPLHMPPMCTGLPPMVTCGATQAHSKGDDKHQQTSTQDRLKDNRDIHEHVQHNNSMCLLAATLLLPMQGSML